MATIWNDIRYAVRGFRRTPLFTAIAAASLAFGIGANTAIFSLLDQVLLRVLPVKHPEQLVLLTMRGHHYGNNWGANAISYPMYRDFRAHNQVFSDMFCRFSIELGLGYGQRTERVPAELVSGTYFPVLGISASLGRLLTPDDDRVQGGHPLAVLSYSFWQTRFAANASILGKTVVVNGYPMTVIGVAQPGFDGVELGHTTKLFIPIMMQPRMMPDWTPLENRRQRWVNAFGRLKPGISREQAKAALQPFMHSMLELEVKEPAFRNASQYVRQQFLKCWIDVLPGSRGRSYLRDQLTKPLWLLMAITGTVLLLACANLANLLLARATTRHREIAIRLAMGAGRRRVVRQLLIESVLLSCLGAALGIWLAFWADHLLLAAYMPAEHTGDVIISPVPDLRILGFTCLIMLVTALLFGLVPALQTSRPELAGTLKEGAAAVLGGSHVFLRKLLVATQVTLSLVLLIGAGLFVRTLANLRDLGPGFSPERLVGFNVDPSLSGYSPEKAKLFFQRLTDEVGSIPGVQSVGLASMRILEDNEWDSSMTVEGYNPKPGQTPDPFMNSISPNYFATLGVPIIAGRDFTIKDVDSVKHGPEPDGWSPIVVIINESFARKYFSGRNPIGLHTGFGSDPGTKTDMQVIGVVKDIKYTNLRDEIPVQAFIPYLADKRVSGMTVYMRTTVDPKQLLTIVRRKLQTLDPNVPIYAMRTTEEQIDLSLRTERLVASLSFVFGFLATVLAVIGLYGVMAYSVSRRTREIGIRMALGALQGNVLWMVMREVLLLIAVGVAVGMPIAVALSALVRNQLFGIPPHDPATLVIATLALLIVASLAGFLPALRASRIDPTRALRYE
ncbi:MAG: ABC transporter permease [Acidobacteriaceae bacterium]|nr:ABC transporter permease [Acidobacteriaceae bacterium]